jgi:hypothetical protein
MAARTAMDAIPAGPNLGDNSIMARRRTKFYEVLKQQQEKEKLVCVYHGDDGHDKFDVGFVESLTTTNLTLLSVSPRGEFDGRVIMHLDDLNRVEMDDRYSRKIELLHQYRGSIFKTEDHVNPQSRTDDLMAQLKTAAEAHEVGSIEDVKGNSVTGFIAEVGEDYVVIEALTQLGEPDGQSVVNLEDVSRVQIGARDQQVRGFLYGYNYKLRKLLEF